MSLIAWRSSIGLAIVGRRIMQQRTTIGIDLDFERDTELPAVTNHRLMMTGQPRCARIPIELLIEFADLPRAVRHLDRGPAPDGPIAAADAIARFEHGAIVAGLAEFVGGRQASNSGPEHDYLGPVRGTFSNVTGSAMAPAAPRTPIACIVR